MYKQVSILIDEEDLKEFKKKLVDKNQDMSSLIRIWVKTWLGVVTPPASPRVPSPKVVIPDAHSDSKLSIQEEEYGVCPTCFVKKPKPVYEVTYLDDDQIRVVNKLCAECIKKSKGADKFIGEGNLT